MRVLNTNRGKFPYKHYDELGWQLSSYNSKQIKDCQNKNHKIKEFDNSIYLNRGTDIICYCDECKIYWHIDMSD